MELVEPVQGREVLVQVAEVVLAELPGGVPLGLQGSGGSTRPGGQAHVGPGLADGGEPGAEWDLAGDETGPPGGTAGLGVVVGEPHPL